MRASEAKKYITAIASQRALSSFTTRSVSAVLAPASAGFSSEPNTSAIAPITKALADSGTQSERMARTLGHGTAAGSRFGAKPPRSTARSRGS